jgi:hypothetical protein
MAKITNPKQRFKCGITRDMEIHISPGELSSKLAEHFKLDQRDISCERIHPSRLLPEYRSALGEDLYLDGMLIPFLILRKRPSEEFAMAFVKKAFDLQGIYLGVHLESSAKEIAKNFFSRRFAEEIATKGDTICPKCKTRLHRKEQRHKTYVLVTITCPNKPWCKWGTSRVVPLTGPRGALSLSVDREDDLDEDKPTENNALACMGSNDEQPVTVPVIDQTKLDAPHECESVIIRAQSVQSESNTQSEPIAITGMQVVLRTKISRDGITIPAGTIGVVYENSGSVVTTRYSHETCWYVQHWLAMSNDEKDENSTFWRDNEPIDSWIGREWIRLMLPSRGFLYNGIVLRTMIDGKLWSRNEQWRIATIDSDDNHDAIIQSLDNMRKISISTKDLYSYFVPVEPKPA